MAPVPKSLLFLPPIDWQFPRRDLPGEEPRGIAHGLFEAGYDCEVLDPLPYPWNPFGKHHPLLRGLDPLRTLRVLFFRRRTSVVVCVFEGPAVLLLLLRRLLGFRGKILMWDIGVTQGWRLRLRLQDSIMPRLDGILALSSKQVSEVRTRWRRHPPLICVGHYVDTDYFSTRPQGPDSGFVLSVGDDVGRDYALLLNAMAGSEARLVIRTRRQLQLDQHRHTRVNIIAERIPFSRLRQLYADAAVVVVPVTDMPHPGGVSTLLEAMAMGCAIVATWSSGLSDWCIDGETCLLVAPEDERALRVAIDRLLRDDALRIKLGRSARAFAERECSVPAFISRFVDAAQALASAGRSR